jgi:hypothetical protein
MNIGQGQITQLAVSDNFLYTTGRWSDPVEGMYGGKWFYVLDISDPSNLLFIDTLCFNVNDFYLSDGLLYLTTENGLEIYNAKNPKNLEKIGNYLLKNANSVCVKDGIIYVSGAGILYTLKVDLPTEIVENSGKVTAFNLKQNYPNPFNPKTVINYQLPITSTVELGIYNILGQKVATLVSGKQQAGNYQVEWDATNFASGVYMYRMQAGKYSETKKLILLR